MRERRPEKSAPTPWRVPVAVEDIPETGEQFTLVADADTRAAVARIAGLRALPRLQANFAVTGQGAGGLHVVGRVSATVGQNCVVTLEPIDNEVEEEVDLVFMPQPAPEASAGEGEDEEGVRDVKWGDPEPLIGGQVDLGALATEFLILGLDPYPRKPGAVFEPAPEGERHGGPFAALAGWAKSREGH